MRLVCPGHCGSVCTDEGDDDDDDNDNDNDNEEIRSLNFKQNKKGK
jgi:hypothetical protein